jgi:hypothetical protein
MSGTDLSGELVPLAETPILFASSRRTLRVRVGHLVDAHLLQFVPDSTPCNIVIMSRSDMYFPDSEFVKSDRIKNITA